MLNKILLLLFIIYLTSPIFSQENDSIIIQKNDSLKLYNISKIVIKGNKKTKNYIIEREIVFHEKDSTSIDNLKLDINKSIENLENTSLFNSVNIFYDTVNKNNINILIDVQERWYLWPFPVFSFAERDINTWLKTKDYSRLNYGFYLQQDNFRGRMERLRLLFQNGYDKSVGICYEIPYVSKNLKSGLSFLFQYINNHEIGYEINNNELIYYKDINNYVRQEYLSQVKYIYRNKIHNTNSLILTYNNFSIKDTISDYLNKNYFLNKLNKAQEIKIEYLFKSDHRNYKSYPLNGYYFDINISNTFFNFFTNNSQNYFSISSLYRKYFELNKRFYYATSLKVKLTEDKKPPFILNNSLGYDADIIRGYEYYVINGQQFLLYKHNIKFAIIPKKDKNIKFISLNKFNNLHYSLYLNIFNDIAYVSEKYYKSNNSLTNKFLYSYGLGLDFSTYYDKVIRIEYSINGLNEKGFFIHFIAPI